MSTPPKSEMNALGSCGRGRVGAHHQLVGARRRRARRGASGRSPRARCSAVEVERRAGDRQPGRRAGRTPRRRSTAPGRRCADARRRRRRSRCAASSTVEQLARRRAAAAVTISSSWPPAPRGRLRQRQARVLLVGQRRDRCAAASSCVPLRRRARLGHRAEAVDARSPDTRRARGTPCAASAAEVGLRRDRLELEREPSRQRCLRSRRRRAPPAGPPGRTVGRRPSNSTPGTRSARSRRARARGRRRRRRAPARSPLSRPGGCLVFSGRALHVEIRAAGRLPRHPHCHLAAAAGSGSAPAR